MTSGPRVQRVQRFRLRKQHAIPIGCGCTIASGFGLIGLCTLLYMFGILMPLVLGLFGVERIGDTDDLFETAQSPVIVELTEPVPQSRAVFDLGEYGEEVINTNTLDYTVNTGNSGTGSTTTTAVFTESGLLALCRERSGICRGEDSRLRDVRFDLRPGGVVIYADVNAGFVWQKIGVVLRFDGVRSLDVIGVDIGGSTYDVNTLPAFIPAESRDVIREAVDDIDRIGNDILTNLIVTTGGDNFRLEQVVIDDTQLMLVLR